MCSPRNGSLVLAITALALLVESPVYARSADTGVIAATGFSSIVLAGFCYYGIQSAGGAWP